MKLKLTSIIVLFLIVSLCEAKRGRGRTSNKNEISETSDKRDGKLFSLFTVVNFKNEACVSTSSLSSGSTAYRNGTCFTSSECSSKGGSAKGKCAAGFGVCCVFTYSDSSQNTISYNDSYIQNPSFPSAYGSTSTVSYTINKCSNDVCWLRLDFEDFTIAGTSDTVETSGGSCVDSFTVTVTSGQQIPTICGQNTGQHIYVEVGRGSSDSATLQLGFGDSTTVSRKWDIKVAQIPCGANYAPPSGCLQWQTGLTGQITTFNFLDTAGSHLANQDYSSCIRQESGFCCVQYQVCSDPNSFSLDVEYAAGSEASRVGTNCIKTDATTVTTADYIVIDGSSSVCNTNAPMFSNYCGQLLSTVEAKTYGNIPICDCTAPFYVGIVTDALTDETAAINMAVTNRGVCLDWRQLPC